MTPLCLLSRATQSRTFRLVKTSLQCLARIKGQSPLVLESSRFASLCFLRSMYEKIRVTNLPGFAKHYYYSTNNLVLVAEFIVNFAANQIIGPHPNHMAD